METKRKLQFGAAAVTANALLALGLLSASPAFASCAISHKNVCVCQTIAGCQVLAPPGCTAVSSTCTPFQCPGGFVNICGYQ